MKLIPLLLAVAALAAGCGSAPEAEPPIAEGPPPLVETADGNVVLYVSNQSFERGDVDITVWIDGFVAVDRRFDVGNQHNWVEFRFRLADGPHTLRAESVDGDAVFEERFEVAGKRWAVVDYWCCDRDAGGPTFTFNVSKTAIAFA